MAFLCRRAVSQIVKRCLQTSCKLGKKLKSLEHGAGICGKEKYENTNLETGYDDPFDTLPKKFGPGTKECPNLVGSFFESRLVGCICNDEEFDINWMWLHKGEPRRCECGHWFKLIEREYTSLKSPDTTESQG
ncbi:PREDICTED: cytochrome c oxidase subunit 5B, mitochondrial-like [Ceratosolen solmsi marchali]|uniref:Cytochrome c oxidase subunit 5B, mitochondrial-like n=1 Tax=Ceratosolen solmsi marchali TaxID=326594 RepID=A0AAJ6YKE0_9HYME|nr:PREDICTED: cytochrome c oxidase subunit 5B, mitochondrial-like [Ceratosolen solmsi marchali]